jgi:hypothetical protein
MSKVNKPRTLKSKSAQRARVRNFLEDLRTRTLGGAERFSMSVLQGHHRIAKFSKVPFDCGMVRNDRGGFYWMADIVDEKLVDKYMACQKAHSREKLAAAKKRMALDQNTPELPLDNNPEIGDILDLTGVKIPVPFHGSGRIGNYFYSIVLKPWTGNKN